MAYALEQLNTGIPESRMEALGATPRGRMPQASSPALQTAVFITDSSEYEVRDGICCAVRDRLTGEWRPKHRAIGMELVRVPQRGQILHFVGDSFTVLMTSLVEEVKRPIRLAPRWPRAVRTQESAGRVEAAERLSAFEAGSSAH